MRSHLVALFSLFALSTAQSDADIVIEGRGAAPILPPTLEQGFTPLTSLGGLARRQTSSCRIGYTECGSVCIRVGYSCCPDGRGGCGPTDRCWPSATGYGCCALGKTCVGNAPAPPPVSTLWSSYTSYTTTYEYSTRSSSTRSTSTSTTRRSSSSSSSLVLSSTVTDEDAATTAATTTTAESTSTAPFNFSVPTLPSFTLPTVPASASGTSVAVPGVPIGGSAANDRVSLNVYLMTAVGGLFAAFGLLA